VLGWRRAGWEAKHTQPLAVNARVMKQLFEITQKSGKKEEEEVQ